MDESKVRSETPRRPGVDERAQPRLAQDETPAEERPGGFGIYEEIFIPLDAGKEPDRREFAANRVDAEFAKVSGISAITRAKKALVKGVSGLTMGEKAKVAGIAPLVVSAKKASIKKGAAFVALAGRQVKLKDQGYVGFAIAPKVEVNDGGRVLITPWMAVLIGLSFGLGFGIVAMAGIWAFRGGLRLLRRRKTWSGRMMDRFGAGAGPARRSVGFTRRAWHALRAGMDAF